MLNQPMSSPQMMRMFGFFALLLPFGFFACACPFGFFACPLPFDPEPLVPPRFAIALSPFGFHGGA
jgi:hypothetical protein